MKLINEANKSNSKAYSNYTFLLGRPRKGEYSGLTNDQKCKLQREKLKAKSNNFLNKEKERLAKWRANMKQDQERYDKFKENHKWRKWAKKNKEKEVLVREAVHAVVCAQEETSTQTPGSAFSCRQTLHRSLWRAPIKKQKSYKGWQQSTNFKSISSKIVEDLARS